MTEEYELYALNFSGRVPAVRIYRSREEGVKARSHYRKMGYHVQLDKVVKDAGTEGMGGDNDLSDARGANWREGRLAALWRRSRTRSRRGS